MTVLRFPPQLRAVTLAGNVPDLPAAPDPVLVDHGGRTYQLGELLAHLSPAELNEVEAAMPRTGQATWDEVTRRWPGLAEEIAAGCKAGM